MRISAKADYGLRALIELAVLEQEGARPVKRDQLGAAQDIPVAFLENITLADLVAGDLPREIHPLVSPPEAWRPH